VGKNVKVIGRQREKERRKGTEEKKKKKIFVM
jgi:hypothetical protein